MKKTAILSILLSLCMVVTLLSGVSAFAATEAGTVADIDGYVCPAADGYQNYHFTAEEAGVVTITTDGPSSVENWTSGEGYMQFFEDGGTATISVAEGDVIRVQTQYTSQPVTLAATFTPAGAEGGEDEEVIDTSVLEGTYEAGYASLGMPDMWVLTFNNGILSIQDNNNGNYTGSYDYSVDADGMITISGGDGTLGVIGTPGNYTFFCGGCPGGVAMVKTANASSGEEGGDEPSDEPETLDGTYEAQFYGTPMYQLVFNNGTLTVQSLASVANDVSGTYAYIVVDGLPVADCGLFSKDTGGNLTFQPVGFAMPMTMVKTSNDVGGGEGGDPVDPPESTEPITVWGPSHLNESYNSGAIAAGQTQEYLIYDIVNGTLVITGSNLTVVFNGETYTTSSWNNTISIAVSEEDATNLDDYGIGYAALSVSSSQAANYTMKFEFPLGHGENPQKLDNLLKVPVMLPADNVDGYYLTWTADFTGDLTLYLNQGIEGAIVDITISNEDWSNYASLVTYNDDYEQVYSDRLTIEVEEGVEYTIFVLEYSDDDGNKQGGSIIFSNREELTATGTSDDPFTLEEGDMDLIMEEGKSSDGLYYQYLASANGILTITIQNWDGTNLLISGMTNQGNGVYTMEVQAGQTYTVNPWLLSDAACDMDLTVVFTDESEIEYELGTEQNPEEVDSIDGLVFTVNNSDYYYKWTATESGTLTINLNTTWNYGYNLLVNGESLFGNGETMEIEVAVGDEIVLVNSVYASADSNGSITLSAEFGDGSDVPPAGDYTFLVFALMAMSMTALVVLVSKKRAF